MKKKVDFFNQKLLTFKQIINPINPNRKVFHVENFLYPNSGIKFSKGILYSKKVNNSSNQLSEKRNKFQHFYNSAFSTASDLKGLKNYSSTGNRVKLLKTSFIPYKQYHYTDINIKYTPLRAIHFSDNTLSRINIMEEANKKLQQEVDKKTNNLNKNTFELEEMVKSLKESNEELENFAYVASHDLQEPLRQISTFSQLLERRLKDRLTDEEVKFLNLIVEGTTNMQTLIDDLLLYSKITIKTYSFSTINMNILVSKVIRQLKKGIDSNDIDFNTAILPEIKGKQTLIQQLFQNVINNSIKYRIKDIPTSIEINYTEGENEWIFSVKDNGIGIPKEFQERIFHLFKRLHTKREYPGNGIGLTLCKKIIEQHNGKIWVESQPDKGSIFYFTISKTL